MPRFTEVEVVEVVKHSSRRRVLKLLTVGSIPPEWGGPNAGGVATTHRNLLEQFARNDRLELVGVIPTRIARGARLADHLPLIRDRSEDSYRRLADRADVILMLHVAHVFGQYQARYPHTPCIGSVRSWTPYITAQDRSEARERINVSLGGMASLVFPSLAALTQGEKLGFTYPVQAQVIHSAVSPTYAQALRDTTRHGVVFVGSLKPIKRAHLVIMACRQLGLNLKIIGDGPERPKLEAMADETVTFTGQLEAKEVRNILCSAAVLCVPSQSEGFANVYLEAAACGTPIVGYGPNVDELSSTIGMSIGVGISPEADSEEVGKALETVLSVDWSRQKMRHSILSQFDPVDVANRYLDLMTEIVDQTQ